MNPSLRIIIPPQCGSYNTLISGFAQIQLVGWTSDMSVTTLGVIGSDRLEEAFKKIGSLPISMTIWRWYIYRE